MWEGFLRVLPGETDNVASPFLEGGIRSNNHWINDNLLLTQALKYCDCFL